MQLPLPPPLTRKHNNVLIVGRGESGISKASPTQFPLFPPPGWEFLHNAPKRFNPEVRNFLFTSAKVRNYFALSACVSLQISRRSLAESDKHSSRCRLTNSQAGNVSISVKHSQIHWSGQCRYMIGFSKFSILTPRSV